MKAKKVEDSLKLSDERETKFPTALLGIEDALFG
jgi:hypothetical protein